MLRIARAICHIRVYLRLELNVFEIHEMSGSTVIRYIQSGGRQRRIRVQNTVFAHPSAFGGSEVNRLLLRRKQLNIFSKRLQV